MTACWFVELSIIWNAPFKISFLGTNTSYLLMKHLNRANVRWPLILPQLFFSHTIMQRYRAAE